jgi:transposase-like protein
MKSKHIIQEKYKNVTCPSCNFKKLKKDGKRKTKHRGEIQRYKCKNCKLRFVLDEGFYRMRNHEKKITLCMDLYYNGMSFRKIQEHLKTFYPKNCHYSTAYRWIVKYSMMISNLTNNLQVKSGIELQSDEMEYHRRISKYEKGREQNWFVDVMDTTTRFIVSSGYMRSRTIDSMVKVLKRGKFATQEQVKIVTTDGLRGYPRMLKKSFGLKTHWNHKSPIIHNVVIASERGFNHYIERLHNSIRERTKVMRGFHGCMESASAIMKGYEIYYNFIRKHQGIGCCPYELAIPELELGKNKWLDLIKLSKV